MNFLHWECVTFLLGGTAVLLTLHIFMVTSAVKVATHQWTEDNQKLLCAWAAACRAVTPSYGVPATEKKMSALLHEIEAMQTDVRCPPDAAEVLPQYPDWAAR